MYLLNFFNLQENDITEECINLRICNLKAEK